MIYKKWNNVTIIEEGDNMKLKTWIKKMLRPSIMVYGWGIRI